MEQTKTNNMFMKYQTPYTLVIIYKYEKSSYEFLYKYNTTLIAYNQDSDYRFI